MAISHCILNHTTLPVGYGLTCPCDDMQWHKTLVFVGELHVSHFLVYLTPPQLNARSDHPIGIKPRLSILFDHQCHNNMILETG
ncbi:hypothetical protein Bca4012_102651 [Brassica carinata]